jgi:starch phosphorylase
VQTEQAAEWVVDDFLTELPQRGAVTIEGRTVHVRAWRYDVAGTDGGSVPVLLLDTDLPENSPWDRRLTDYLYGGDAWVRLCQEIVLGVGGVRLLRALGHRQLGRFHMNEGHAGLLTLELLHEQSSKAGRAAPNKDDEEAVRGLCVFTTHTPVPAGHDQFPMEFLLRALGRVEFEAVKDVLCCEGLLNMTYLALNLSHYVNGVAKKHAEVSQHMFAQYRIDAVTNGVHPASWASPPIQALFDRHIPGWRSDSFMLRYALSIPPQEVWDAHQQSKRRLIEHVNTLTNAGLDHDHFTICFARRVATYKRADLLFQDLQRLKEIAAAAGPFQIVFAGKAHPHDAEGKEIIRRIFQARDALRGLVKVAYLPNYDWTQARLMVAGADVWLNTPQPPLEASGTSGMKAAVNGVPSLSTLDGWWIEGYIEDTTGWAIGELCKVGSPAKDRADCDATSLYETLGEVVIPAFYGNRDHYVNIMRHAIALNGSFFNTHRMLLQYVLKAYFK